ncbi:HAD family hydrolase [Massilia sp. W12]|uniref:HAD family hydrolase n=1 Tax=Massilia sp. W12 TaxID=3126507 RepID=UPI0030CF9D6E
MQAPTQTPLRAVLFDLDDTLWPAARLLANAEQQMMQYLARHAPRVLENGAELLRRERAELLASQPQLQVDLWNLRLTVLRNALARSGTPDPQQTICAGAMQAYVKARNAVTLYADVQPVLRELKGNYLLGTISNGFADLQQIGLAPFFQVRLAAHRFGRAKPDAEIFLAACEALRIAPQQAVYVGDDPELDVLGARRAGLRSVWLKRNDVAPRAHAQAESDADAVCADLREMCAWLQQQT